MNKKNSTKEKVKTCCICGCHFHGWGNNPDGALNKDFEPIKWNAEDVCCDECDDRYVIPGRIYLYQHRKKEVTDK